MTTKPAFTEKQYLGRDFNRISIRVVMMIFAFAAYFVTENRDRNGDLFLIVGFAILIVSIFMLFMVHYRTTVQNKSVILDGLWTTKLVKIDLNSIVKVQRRPYSSYLLNNPVYNLHQKGKIRFYAGGKDAISLTDRDGLEYIIGTQCPEEFEKALVDEMKK
ncbi:hypothetical protein ACFSJU_06520 [Paradesertivirga mongoliensis]|uniref:PH domain-containing protein n=1 Tax=Paradesertivirga mongoliensis TaxID=2100740 RepID=A0ABW4ZJV7_9SPHI|nr:hypothetical protein [Pedobacter mongoliensis]